MEIDEYHAMIANQTVKRGKWNNVKTEVDGFKFDSKREAARFEELRLLETAGEISALTPHPKPAYILQAGFRAKNGIWYKAITYSPDFSYVQGGEFTIEDIKGKKTDVFKVKEKLFRFAYPDIRFILTK